MSNIRVKNKLVDLTWPELANKQIDFWVLPTGSVEQHGPHLPLGSDFFLAEKISSVITNNFHCLELPSTPLGVNFAFSEWPGTIGISPETYMNLIIEIASKASKKCPRLLIISAHDENLPLLHLIAQNLTEKHGMEVAFFEWAEFVLDVIRSVSESSDEMHAGEALTSLFLHWFPQHVLKENIRRGSKSRAGVASDDIHLDHRAFNPIQYKFDNQSSGVFGNPTLSSKEKGEHITDELIKRAFNFINDLQWSGKNE
ncbi:creatininase family protein [Priestia aryabhattai]|uniref:creatininase family protein n=1 Tax=Priestia TaxID=2800373 RepID=UPI000BF82495|nr:MULTISPECIES: creatininase family protein [Priestia]MCM3185913.1 creatininase family protein [Priestia megaterium]MDH3135449.1 creatininase family protein [Priestia aryabhattai]PFK99286.1 hypothetical protein COJ01_20065 [Priestia megaterium]RCX19555.1 creatinine amidohydrolase [Bacillus sp. AG236]